MFQERESQIKRALENLNFSKSSGSSSDTMEYERCENLRGTQPSKSLHDNLQPNWQVMKDEQTKRSLRDYLYPTHANTSSSMNVWGGCGYNTQSSWTCPTRSDYYIRVLQEIEDEANATFVPPSIEWSYETPSKCSYVPPSTTPEVQSLEDVISKFIQSQNKFI